MKHILRNISLIIGSVTFALIITEVLIRLFVPQELPTTRDDIWIPKDIVGVWKASNIDTMINSGEGMVRFITDAGGYRIGSAPAPIDAPRLLLVGDSFIEAVGVEYEHSISGLMELILTKRCEMPIHIVSAGVGGWNPNQYLSQTRMELEHSDYELVIVFIYVGNDIVNKRTGPVQPRRQSIPPFRMPKSFDHQELINATIYPLYKRLTYRSHLVVLIKSSINAFLMRTGFSRHHFPATLVRSNKNSELWDVTVSLSSDIAVIADSHNVPIMFVILPADYQVDEQLGEAFAKGSSIDPSLVDLEQSNRILAQKLMKDNFQVIDTTTALRHAFQDGRKPYADFDRHLSNSGHVVVVDKILPTTMELLQINSCN